MKFLLTCVGMRAPDPHLGKFRIFEGPIVMKTWGGSGGRTDMLFWNLCPPDLVIDKWRIMCASYCIVACVDWSFLFACTGKMLRQHGRACRYYAVSLRAVTSPGGKGGAELLPLCNLVQMCATLPSPTLQGCYPPSKG
jgi:hypothetical protein